MRVTLLHNPTAGEQDHAAEQLVDLLRSEGYEPEYHALKQAIQDPGCLDSGEFVIVAGGDGSIRKVATLLVGRGRAIAPLPLGTANNISRSLGIEGTAREIIQSWRPQHRRKIDVGAIKGLGEERRFLEGLGAGLFSRAITLLEQVDEWTGDSFSSRKDKLLRDEAVLYAVAATMAPVPIRVSLDGRQLSGDFLVVEVMNIRGVGPRVELAPNADPSDGHLDVVVVTTDERAQLEEHLKHHLCRGSGAPGLRVHAVRSMRMEFSSADLRIDDGVSTFPDKTKCDNGRACVIDVALEPGALEFIVPEPARRKKPRAAPTAAASEPRLA